MHIKKIKKKLIFLFQKFDLADIGKDTIIIFSIQIILMILSFFPSIAVARILGPEIKGKLDLFTLIENYIVEFGMLGFGTGLLYYQSNKKVSLGKIHGTGIGFAAIMGGITLIFGILMNEKFSMIFNGLEKPIIILSLAFAPLFMYKIIFSNILLGLNKAVINSYIALIIGVVTSGSVLLLWWNKCLTYTSMLIIMIVQTLISISLGFIYIKRRERKIQFCFTLAKKTLKYGVVMYIGFMANTLLFRMDQLFLNIYEGNKAVGIYSVAVRWAEMLFLLDSALNSAAIYKIASTDRHTGRKIANKIMKLQFTVNVIFGMFLAGISYPMITLLYGKVYITAVTPLIILIPGVVLWSVGKTASQYMAYNSGKANYCTFAAIAGVICNGVLNIILIPRYSIIGAAIASSVSYSMVILFTIIFYIYIKKEDGKNEQV